MIGKIEGGERLAYPPGCSPRLYSVLTECWAYEPTKRPTFKALKAVLSETLVEARSCSNFPPNSESKTKWPKSNQVQSSSSNPQLSVVWLYNN